MNCAARANDHGNYLDHFGHSITDGLSSETFVQAPSEGPSGQRQAAKDECGNKQFGHRFVPVTRSIQSQQAKTRLDMTKRQTAPATVCR